MVETLYNVSRIETFLLCTITYILCSYDIDHTKLNALQLYLFLKMQVKQMCMCTDEYERTCSLVYPFTLLKKVMSILV